jgi:hypothetical protein
MRYQYLIFLLVSLVSLRAQVSSGSLLGVVNDASGSPVADVKVTARHEATGFTRSVTTGPVGQYRIGDLIPGAYTVTAEKQGFRTVTTSAVEIEVNQKGRVDLKLEVGPARDSVTVEASASPVETDDASVGYLLHSPTVLSLPLSTRNVASLVTLGPGAIPRQLGGFTNDIQSDYQGSRGLVQMNAPVNGARSTANTYLLDGASNTDRLVFAMAMNAPLESVQEFRIQSSSATAEFAQAGGAVVDVVTKSGSKRLHGSVFEYFRNEATDARNYFDDPTLPRPIFRQNQFGGSAGGPTGLHNTFFFVTYEGQRGRSAKSSLSVVPDATIRTGNFAGASPLFDPLTLDPKTGARAPFAGNLIPANRIDSVAKQYLAQYEPLPNSNSAGGNYLDATPDNSSDDSVSVRLDHEFRNQGRLFGRYTINDQRDRVNASFPLRPTNENVRAQQVALGYTAGRNSWLSETRFSFLRLRVYDVPVSALGADVAAQLGVTGVSRDPFTFGLPYFLVNNYSTLTDDPAIPKVQRDNSWNFSEGVSFMRGRHMLKVGGQAVHFQLNYLKDQFQRGQFIYSGAFTQDLNAPDGTGDPLADFLLGYPQNTTRNVGNAQAYLRQNVLAGYVQDDWRVSPNLTLNVGLRYEYISPYSEARGNLLNLDYSHLPGAPVLVRGSTAANPDRKNFAPRLGLAWRIPGRHAPVFRAAYGIYYAPETAIDTYDLMFNGIRAESNATDGVTPVLTTKNGFPSTASLGFPAYYGLDPNGKTPYIQQWQAGFQQELRGRILLDLTYLGTKGTRLGRFRQNNTPLHTVDGENLAPRPGDLQALREFPTIGPIVQRENLANSIYHSLQVKVEKRLSSRLTVLASFVWSKSIDDTDNVVQGAYDNAGAQDERNLHLERGLSYINAGRRVAASAVFNLPNRQFLRPVLGGWQLSTVVTLQDGTPLNADYFSTDNANSGTINRPNIVPGQSIALARSQRSTTEFFNVNAFSDNAPYTFGNSGRDTVPGPGNNIFDIALQKRFSVRERGAVMFRAEFYNAFNHPNWGIPLTFLDFGPLFGEIAGTGDPRRMQFALRFEY